MHDLAIIGGGPAGVAAAYYLRDLGLDLVILEAEDALGGRTLSVDVAGAASNTGAMFVYRGTPAEELVGELGIRTMPFTPSTYGIHVAGATTVDSDNDRLIDRLPISPTSRRQLRQFVATALDEYRALTAGGRLTGEADRLAGASMADRLYGLAPDVAEIITRAVQGGSVANPAELSAQYALRYFASYLAHETENRLYPVDGMQSIIREMGRRLPEGTVRVNARAARATRQADDTGEECFEIDLVGDAPVRAREVLLAVPAPIALALVPELPDWKREALTVARTPGSTTLSVTVDVTGLDDDTLHWAFIAVAGRAFDAVVNPVPGDTRRTADGRCLVQFVCYGNSAGYRPDLVEGGAGTDSWVEDFLAVAPHLRGRILGAHLQTWEHCFAIITPERVAALPSLRASVGGLHFAGDHTSATAGTHGAYAEARRVADLIRATR